MSFWRLIKQGSSVGSISAATNSFSIDATGGSDYTPITSTSAWSHDATTVPAWIDVLTGSGVSGDFFEFDIAANGGTARSASIKVWLDSNHSVYVNISISQAAA